MIKSVAIFCGSKPSNKRSFQNLAKETGKFLARNGIELVYGGAKDGLMGLVADAVLENDGTVIGVMPDFVYWEERIHPNLSEFIQTKTMEERKAIMMDRSDCCVCLPGGLGTLDELFEYATATELRLHKDKIFKPCGLLSIEGYYKGLIEFLNEGYFSELITKPDREIIQTDINIESLFQKLQNAFDSNN